MTTASPRPQAAPAPSPDRPPPTAGVRQWLGLAVLVLPTLLLTVDITVLMLALPALATDLGASSVQQLWIVDIYGFVIAGLLLTMGNLGDRIGRRRLLLAGGAAFAAASLVAAWSTGPEMLIAARALLGVAGATVMPSTLALIRTMFADPGQRRRAVALWSAGAMGGMALGPALGGLLLQHFWWGSVFLLAVPIMGLLLVAGPLLLPEYRDPAPGRPDLPGVALSLAMLLPLVYALKQVAKDGPRPGALAALLVGLVAGWLFVRRQRRAEAPLVDLALLRVPGFGAGLTVILVASMMMGYSGLLMAQYLQLVAELSPGAAGAWMVPSPVLAIVATLLTPRAAAAWGERAVFVGALLLAAGGILLFGAAGAVGAGPAAAVAGMGLVSIAMSPLPVLVNTMVISTAPKERTGAASSLSETSMEVGAGLGIAAFGSLLTAVYRARLDPAAWPGDAAETAREGLAAAAGAAEGLPGAAALLADAQDAHVAGQLAVVGVGAALLIALTAVARRFRPERH